MTTKITDTSVELSRYFDDSQSKTVIITIDSYKKLVDNQNKDSIADFIYYRLYSRYLKPFSYKSEEFIENYKNGFSIMANCCLLIETLQSFKNGWGDSDRRSGKAFKDFFSTDKNFDDLKSKGVEIHKNVRCGILHQGETTGGWRINRSSKDLFNEKTKSLNAFKFAKLLEKSLSDYKEELKKEKWDSATWDNFRTKMRKIISNCEP